MRNFQWGFGGPGAKPPGNFTVFDHLKHRKRSRRMYENRENFNSLWENIFLDFELMGKVSANHPPHPRGVSRLFYIDQNIRNLPKNRFFSRLRRAFGYPFITKTCFLVFFPKN